MLLETGTQERVLAETTVAAGTTERQGSIESDALLATLWVESVTSGDLTVSVYTLTEEGKEALLFSFPTIAAPTGQLVLRKSGVSMQRFLIRTTYTGICNYEIYVRAIANPGASTVTILGAANASASSATATNVVGVLIPASLIDRSSLIIKNNNNVGTLYIGFTPAVTVADGYPLGPHESLGIDLQSGVSIYSVADVPTIDVRILTAGA